MFSVRVFTAPLGSGFQLCSVLGLHIHRLLSSLAGTFRCSSRAELIDFQLPNSKKVKKSMLFYGRLSVGQSVLVSSPRPDFCCCQKVAGLPIWGALSGERTGLPFTIAAGSSQRNHSRVRVPPDSWPYFTVSDNAQSTYVTSARNA
jgi:hypothetical protein